MHEVAYVIAGMWAKSNDVTLYTQPGMAKTSPQGAIFYFILFFPFRKCHVFFASQCDP